MNVLANSSGSDQTMPAVELEQALIGCVLTYPAVFSSVSALVDPDHFHFPLHGDIWSIATDLAGQGSTVNALTLRAKMGNPDLGEGTNLQTYLARCAVDTFCGPQMAPDFAKQIREAWALRRIAELSDLAKAEAARPGTAPKALMADLMQELDLTRAKLEPRLSGFKSIEQVTKGTIDCMSAGLQGTDQAGGVVTGLRDLDRKLGGGFRPGQLIIVAGRPGMGKTLAAVSVARQCAGHGHACGFFSLEMASDEIGARLLADHCFDDRRQLAAGDILHGHLSDSDAERVIDAQRDLNDLPIFIDSSSAMTVGEISARSYNLADRLARKGQKLALILIDYLKFVRASERYRGQRHYEVGEITAGLKALAKDLDCAVILLAQLNRQVEAREDKRPQLSDLRESGDIEADADVVMFLFREAYYLETKEPKIGTPEFLAWQDALDRARFRLEIIIAKNRMGQTGAVDVFCHPGASALRNAA